MPFLTQQPTVLISKIYNDRAAIRALWLNRLFCVGAVVATVGMMVACVVSMFHSQVSEPTFQDTLRDPLFIGFVVSAGVLRIAFAGPGASDLELLSAEELRSLRKCAAGSPGVDLWLTTNAAAARFFRRINLQEANGFVGGEEAREREKRQEASAAEKREKALAKRVAEHQRAKDQRELAIAERERELTEIADKEPSIW
jgi:hypothetical protein